MAYIRRLPASEAERLARRDDPSVKLTGKWQVRYRDEMDRERGASFATLAEAKKHKAKVETEQAEGDWIDPSYGEVTVGQWIALWRKSRIVARTTSSVQEALIGKHIEPAFGTVPLRAVTKLRVQTWVAELEGAGLAPASVKKIYRLFGTIMKAAVEEQLVRTSPCRGIRLPRARTDERVFLTVEQVQALVAEVPDRYRALIVLAYLSGMRWSELAGLRVKRLDLLRSRLEVVEVAQEAGGTITFGPTKSRASRRTITLPPAAVAAIAAHLAAYPADREDLVFTSARNQVLSRTRFAARVLRPAVDRALLRAWASSQGLEPGTPGEPIPAAVAQAYARAGAPELGPRATFHALRHSHVASLIADGVPMKAIQQRLGHGSITVTFDAYGHLEVAVDEQLLDGLQRRAEQLMPAAST